MIRSLGALSLIALVGCAGDGFTKKEAKTVASAHESASTAAWHSMDQDRSARSTQSTLTWEATDDGYAFSGTLTSDGPDWTGTMDVDGTFEATTSGASWTIDMIYDEVTVDGTTLDGDMALSWAITGGATGFTMTTSTQGTLTATGEAEGTGTIDTTSTLEVSAMGASLSVTGTVDGRKVDFDKNMLFDFDWAW